VNRAQRLLLSGVALTALLAAVAVASRAHRPGGGSGGGSADTGRVVFEYTASVMFVLFPLGALFVLWVLSMGRRQKLIQETGGLRRNVATALSICVLIVPAALLFRHFVKYDGGGPVQPPAGAGTQTVGGARGADQHKEPEFQWLPALIVGSLLFGVAGAGRSRSSSNGSEGPPGTVRRSSCTRSTRFWRTRLTTSAPSATRARR
jgi:hypothetical protein